MSPEPSTSQQPEQRTQKTSVEWVKVIGGALAAMSSAVLLSTLGAAGTLIGAALGSVIVTVGSALYSSGLDKSRRGVAVAQEAALRRVSQARRQVDRAADDQDQNTRVDQHLEWAHEALEDAESRLQEPEPPPPTWGERLRVLPWKRIALVAGGLFLVAMVAITVFELVSGRSISEYTGGSNGNDRTTFSGLTGGGGSAPSHAPSPSSSPSSPVTSTTPTKTPTSTPTTTANPSGLPTPTLPTPSPSTSPSPSSSGTPGSSQSPSPTP
jgi:hypothetical protein